MKHQHGSVPYGRQPVKGLLCTLILGQVPLVVLLQADEEIDECRIQ